MTTDLEWYKEIWEEFIKIPLDEEENWTKKTFFIWPEETDVNDILDWFSVNTDYKLPPQGYQLTWETSNYCDSCECDPCECDDDRCPDCGNIECICDCEHEDINSNGECRNCGRDMQDDCPHHNHDEAGSCTRCWVDSETRIDNIQSDRRNCNGRAHHMQSTYVEEVRGISITYCLYCDQTNE